MARLSFKTNDYFIKVKRCCASCKFKYITEEGERLCTWSWKTVEAHERCCRWEMANELQNAGMSGGVVRLKGTTDVVIR